MSNEVSRLAEMAHELMGAKLLGETLSQALAVLRPEDVESFRDELLKRLRGRMASDSYGVSAEVDKYVSEVVRAALVPLHVMVQAEVQKHLEAVGWASRIQKQIESQGAEMVRNAVQEALRNMRVPR